MNQINKELLNLYFSGNCSPNERLSVEDWIKKSEKNQELFYEALEQWESDNLKTSFNTSAELNKIFNKVLASEYDENFGIGKSKTRSFHGYKVAATLLALLVFSIVFFYLKRDNQIIYSSGFGETKTILLPDHSKVVLNSNSSVRLSNDWDDKKPREVILQGEAYFSVVHTVSSQKFIVRASDNVNIQVLGTEFDVKTRRNRTTVVLNKGKVQLNIRDKKKDIQLTMKPGELIEVGSQSEIKKQKVNPEIYNSWKINKLKFNQSTLQEIAFALEDIYGKKIIIENDSLKLRKFTGTVSRDNLNILLTGLSQAFDFEIIQNKDKIYFKPNK
jgi:transmembrane sensor